MQSQLIVYSLFDFRGVGWGDLFLLNKLFKRNVC